MTAVAQVPDARADALAETLEAIDRDDEWMTWRVGTPAGEPGWVRCADVDAAFVTGWERLAADRHVADYGRSDRMAAAAYVLDWYAGLSGTVGGALFRRARRVPRLHPAALAFRRHATEAYPDAVALTDGRFWCLPDDPAAAELAATVVPDDAALAAVLRAQVRAHADWFLAWYRPGARLARRNLLGAFFDGLDCGLWTGAAPAPTVRAQVLGDAAAVLPGGTAEFADASTLYLLTDARGRTHLSRRRVSCCHYYRIEPEGTACFTCPRTSAADRSRRAAAWDEVC